MCFHLLAKRNYVKKSLWYRRYRSIDYTRLLWKLVSLFDFQNFKWYSLSRFYWMKNRLNMLYRIRIESILVTRGYRVRIKSRPTKTGYHHWNQRTRFPLVTSILFQCGKACLTDFSFNRNGKANTSQNFGNQTNKQVSVKVGYNLSDRKVSGLNTVDIT